MLAIVDNWRDYVQHNVAFDLNILRQAQKRFPVFIDSKTLVPRDVAQSVAKAYVHVMFFAHGANKAYNYALKRHMFAD